MILSGYSSRILEMRRVPIPDPVPPPREWVSWNPWRQSQDSASFLTTSRTESTSSAPVKVIMYLSILLQVKTLSCKMSVK